MTEKVRPMEPQPSLGDLMDEWGKEHFRRIKERKPGTLADLCLTAVLRARGTLPMPSAEPPKDGGRGPNK